MKYGDMRTMLLNELDADYEYTATTDVEFRGTQNLFEDANTDMFEIYVSSYTFESSSDVETAMYVEAELLQPYSYDSRTKGQSKNIAVIGVDTSTGNDTVTNANGGLQFRTIVKRPNGDQLRIKLIDVETGGQVSHIKAGWVLVLECRPIYHEC